MLIPGLQASLQRQPLLTVLNFLYTYKHTAPKLKNTHFCPLNYICIQLRTVGSKWWAVCSCLHLSPNFCHLSPLVLQNHLGAARLFPPGMIAGPCHWPPASPCPSIAVFVNQVLCPPENTGQCLEIFLVATAREEALLASSGERSSLFLNIAQCMGSPRPPQTHLAQDVNRAEVEQSCLV